MGANHGNINDEVMDDAEKELVLLDLCERIFENQIFYFKAEEILFALKKTLSRTDMDVREFLELMDKNLIKSSGREYGDITRSVASIDDLAALVKSIEEP